MFKVEVSETKVCLVSSRVRVGRDSTKGSGSRVQRDSLSSTQPLGTLEGFEDKGV